MNFDRCFLTASWLNRVVWPGCDDRADLKFTVDLAGKDAVGRQSLESGAHGSFQREAGSVRIQGSKTVCRSRDQLLVHTGTVSCSRRKRNMLLCKTVAIGIANVVSGLCRPVRVAPDILACRNAVRGSFCNSTTEHRFGPPLSASTARCRSSTAIQIQRRSASVNSPE